jgi:hypothetical protein
VKHRAVTQTAITVAVWCGQQCSDLIRCQGINEPHLASLERQCMDAQHLIEASWYLIFDVSKEGSNGRKTSIPGRDAVLTNCLYMIQKG